MHRVLQDMMSVTYADAFPIPTWSEKTITVPAGCYFLLGDNTHNSLDSRYWEEPFVTEDQIVAIVPQR